MNVPDGAQKVIVHFEFTADTLANELITGITSVPSESLDAIKHIVIQQFGLETAGFVASLSATLPDGKEVRLAYQSRPTASVRKVAKQLHKQSVERIRRQ